MTGYVKWFLNLTTEACCELRILIINKWLLPGGWIQRRRRETAAGTLRAFTCNLVSNWLTQKPNRLFQESVLGPDVYDEHKQPKQIKLRMLKFMEHHQLSDRLYFTAGICGETKWKKAKKRQWRRPDGLDRAHPVSVYLVDSRPLPTTTAPRPPRSCVCVSVRG